MGEIRTEQLRPHPLNVKLYGKETHADLLDSIGKLGVLEPIVYSRMSVNGGDAHCYIGGLRINASLLSVVLHD